jgi:hypothetical protein
MNLMKQHAPIQGVTAEKIKFLSERAENAQNAEKMIFLVVILIVLAFITLHNVHKFGHQVKTSRRDTKLMNIMNIYVVVFCKAIFPA